jgi:ribosomal protein L37AE/L43A
MKTGHFFLDKIIAPLIVALLTPTIVSISSKVKTGNWTSWINHVPKIILIIFALLIFIWIVFIAIRKRIKFIKEENRSPGIFTISNPLFGWIAIGKLDYAGLIWRISAPSPAPWESFNPSNISPSRIEADTPPRCPKCETEIEESHNFLGGYVWKCVRCGFRKRNKNSFYKEVDRAEKIARREWEKQNF